MELLDAVEQVLKSANQPLHVKTITDKLIRDGLWKSSGKTPDRTVGARLYRDINTKGAKSSFVKVAPNTFSLNGLPKLCENTAPDMTLVNETQRTRSEGAYFTFIDCAQKVLEENGGNKSMHYRDITEIALQKGWLNTGGKTPAATMYAQLITLIKSQQKHGKQPRFVKHGKGYFSLSQSTDSSLTIQIEQHNQQVRKALHDKLLALTPGEFEEFISQLLVEMGFEMVEVTKLTGDGGIDVRGTLVIGEVVRIKMAVQVKRWKVKNNVQSPTVQQMRGSLGAHEHGLIITTSDFSSGAINEAIESDKTPIALMNGDQLVSLLMEYEIGANRSRPDLFEIDDEVLLVGGGKE